MVTGPTSSVAVALPIETVVSRPSAGTVRSSGIVSTGGVVSPPSSSMVTVTSPMSVPPAGSEMV